MTALLHVYGWVSTGRWKNCETLTIFGEVTGKNMMSSFLWHTFVLYGMCFSSAWSITSPVCSRWCSFPSGSNWQSYATGCCAWETWLNTVNRFVNIDCNGRLMLISAERSDGKYDGSFCSFVITAVVCGHWSFIKRLSYQRCISVDIQCTAAKMYKKLHLNSLARGYLRSLKMALFIILWLPFVGMCCEKKTLIGRRNVWNMRWRAPDQEVEQKGRGERLCKKIAKHSIWTGRMLSIVVDGRSW